MNIERLEKMAELLENMTLPKETTFDLACWAHSKEGLEQYHEESCGTVVCACGYAALNPWFQTFGFIAVDDNGGHVESIEQFNQLAKENGKVQLQLKLIGPDGYGVVWDWVAVRTFFEISDDDSNSLFSEYSYDKRVTPGDVALRIRNFISEEGK